MPPMSDLLPPGLFSIGHSNMEMEEFVDLLGSHQIAVLADVRSAPYSSYSPWFGKRDLEGRLTKAGIRYVFMGKELGGRPVGEEYYYPHRSEMRVHYDKVAETQLFQDGLEELWKIAESARTAMMCSEEEPGECHRYKLITWQLYEQSRPVAHILRDGALLRTAEVKTFEKVKDYWLKMPLFS